MSGGARAGWITGVKGKVYGLQKPQPAVPIKKPFSFEDSDDESSSKGKGIVKLGGSSLEGSKLIQRKMAEALAEDPSAFDYDGVYDNIQKSREGPSISERKKEAKQPKYINSLLKQAAERKREDQRLDEKRIIKEKEAEQAEFGDTEMFLTSGYKKKLQENRKWDEEQRLLKEKEQREDATKQGMFAFYSNFLKDNVSIGVGKKVEEPKVEIQIDDSELRPGCIDPLEMEAAKELQRKKEEKAQALLAKKTPTEPAPESGETVSASATEGEAEPAIPAIDPDVLPPGERPLNDDEEWRGGKRWKRMPWGYIPVESEEAKKEATKRKTQDEIDAVKRRALERKKQRLQSGAVGPQE